MQLEALQGLGLGVQAWSLQGLGIAARLGIAASMICIHDLHAVLISTATVRSGLGRLSMQPSLVVSCMCAALAAQLVTQWQVMWQIGLNPKP